MFIMSLVWNLTRCKPSNATSKSSSIGQKVLLQFHTPKIAAHIGHRHQTQASTPSKPLQSLSFWKCRHTWKRAMVNTTRCLIGCSLGDLSTMWYLMTYHPSMNAASSMSLSSTQTSDLFHQVNPADGCVYSDRRYNHLDPTRDTTPTRRQGPTGLGCCGANSVRYEPSVYAGHGVH